MSIATARTNIKILALPPNAEAKEEEARRQEMKDAKKRGQRARVKKWRGQKTKKSPAVEWHIYKKNIV
jgi:ATP-dependent DNA helicase PIF1